MKKFIFGFIFIYFFYGCSPKIIYVPTETIRTVKEIVKDTIVEVRNVPSFDSIVTLDTLSIIDRKTAKTTAKISRGVLSHTLEVKDVPIKVRIQYVQTTIHDTTTKVLPLTKEQTKRINAYDRLTEQNKQKTATIWKLAAVILVLLLWTFRKVFKLLL